MAQLRWPVSSPLTMYGHSRVQRDPPWPLLSFRCNKLLNNTFCSILPSSLLSYDSKFGNFSAELRLHEKTPYPKSFRNPRVSESPFVTDDVSSFGELIRQYVDDGFPDKAVKLFVKMLECGVSLERFRFFPSLVKGFGELFDVNKVREIQLHLVKLGVLNEDVYVANSLLGVYWKCGASEDAIRLFDQMPVRDSISWNTMVSGLSHLGDYVGSLRMFSRMIKVPGILPNRVACVSALTACAALESLARGREIHGFVLRNGLSDEFVVSGLMDLYMKCGNVKNAGFVFEGHFDNEFVRVNTVIWNVMIMGYVSNGYLSRAMDLFLEMLETGVLPDSSTMVAVLVLCSEIRDLEVGKQVHGLVVSLGLCGDVRVETSLIEMYFKCGESKSGFQIFRCSPIRNCVMWGSIILNCAQSGFPMVAFELFHDYVLGYGSPDPVILLASLRACSSLNLKFKGLAIHGLVVKSGFNEDVFIGGALVDLYVKCRDVESAQKVFCALPIRDLISWNALISGYAQNGCPDEALKAFRDMLSEKIRPNTVTSVCILSVCASLSAMRLCKEIHGYVFRRGLSSNILISNSLIAAYAKCGNIDSSWNVFQKMLERDVVSWNSIFHGLSMHGKADEIFVLFEEMLEGGMKPSHATFTALLSACSHAGRLEEGFKCFRKMEYYNVEPQLEHYTCMVDLLGRSGNLKQAYDLILAMPWVPDDRIWGSLLASCKSYGDRRLAEVVVDQILKLDPENIGYRVLLSNLYRDYGKWNEVIRVRTEIKDMGLKKSPGCSWIEVNNNIHTFIAGDRSHNQSLDIYETLDSLTTQIRKAAYVPISPLATIEHNDGINEDPTSIGADNLIFHDTTRGSPNCFNPA